MSAAARRRSEQLGQSKAGGGRFPSPSTSAGLVSKCPPDLSRCAASTPRRTMGVHMERAKGAMDAGAEVKFCTARPSEPRAVLARGAAAQAVALASRARAVLPAHTDKGRWRREPGAPMCTADEPGYLVRCNASCCCVATCSKLESRQYVGPVGALLIGEGRREIRPGGAS